MLDLTSREKEQPTAEGAPAPSQVQEELPAEEVPRGPAAPPGDGEAQGAGESQEHEDKRGVEERDEDADGPEEDTVSNKSLDLNLASRLMGFKLAEGDAGATGSGGPAQQDQKYACDVCGKSFKFQGTLSRHRKAHGREEPQEDGPGASGGGAEGPLPGPAAVPAPEPEEKPALPPEEPLAEGVASSSEASGEKQGEEAEGASDGESVAEKKSSEKSDDDKKPKTDSPRSATSKADKRKKVCSVCNKRFWSLQDLTRHMRSHTGKGRGASTPHTCRACPPTAASGLDEAPPRKQCARPWRARGPAKLRCFLRSWPMLAPGRVTEGWPFSSGSFESILVSSLSHHFPSCRTGGGLPCPIEASRRMWVLAVWGPW